MLFIDITSAVIKNERTCHLDITSAVIKMSAHVI